MPRGRPPTAPPGGTHNDRESDGSPRAGGAQEEQETWPLLSIPSFRPAVPLNDVSRQPTVQWGEGPTRRLVFTHYAEEHEIEVKRLQARLADLEEAVPQRGVALAILERRRAVLEHNERARLSAGELRDLTDLIERLPGGLATFKAEQAELLELPQRIEYHKRAARVWRRRAALEV
jgi:hypothetical protein